MKLTGFPELCRWDELPVWAALLIKNTAPGLALPDRWQGWEYWGPDQGRILVWASGYSYNVVRNHPYVF